MARIHTNLSYSDTKAELSEYKDARHGALDDAFWDEEELVDHRRKGKKKPRKRTRCPESENGRHVYVVVRVKKKYNYWNRPGFFFMTYDEKTCCGCLRVSRRKFVSSER